MTTHDFTLDANFTNVSNTTVSNDSVDLNLDSIFTGGTSGADSSYAGDFASANAFDGSDTSRWASAATAFPHYLTYDLGVANTATPTRITVLPFYYLSHSRVKDYVFYGSNNSTDWTSLTAGQHPDNADWYEDTFINITAYRYFRFTVSSTWDASLIVSVFELEGNGEITGTFIIHDSASTIMDIGANQKLDCSTFAVSSTGSPALTIRYKSSNDSGTMGDYSSYVSVATFQALSDINKRYFAFEIKMVKNTACNVDSVSFDSTSAITATVTLPAFITAANAERIIDVSGAVILPTFTIAAVGARIIKVTGQAILPEFVTAAETKKINTITGQVILPNIIMDAVGERIIKVDGQVILPTFTTAANAERIIKVDGQVILSEFVTDAVGARIIKVTGQAILPEFITAAETKRSIDTIGQVILPAFTTAAIASKINEIVGVVVLPNIVTDAIAKRIVKVAGNAVMPNFVTAAIASREVSVIGGVILPEFVTAAFTGKTITVVGSIIVTQPIVSSVVATTIRAQAEIILSAITPAGIVQITRVMPSTPTLTVLAGTNTATFTVSGSDAETENKIYYQVANGAGWTEAGTLTGDGSVTLSMTPASYWGYVESRNTTGCVTTKPIFFTVVAEIITISYSPAEIMQQRLIDLELFTDPAVKSTWPAYVSHMPDGKNTEDNLIAVYNTAGIKNGRMPDGEVIYHDGIQLRIRSKNQKEGWSKIQVAASILSKQGVVLVTLGSVTYRLVNVVQTSSAVSLGVESTGKRRFEFTVNFVVLIKEI